MNILCVGDCTTPRTKHFRDLKNRINNKNGIFINLYNPSLTINEGLFTAIFKLHTLQKSNSILKFNCIIIETHEGEQRVEITNETIELLHIFYKTYNLPVIICASIGSTTGIFSTFERSVRLIEDNNFNFVWVEQNRWFKYVLRLHLHDSQEFEKRYNKDQYTYVHGNMSNNMKRLFAYTYSDLLLHLLIQRISRPLIPYTTNVTPFLKSITILKTAYNNVQINGNFKLYGFSYERSFYVCDVIINDSCYKHLIADRPLIVHGTHSLYIDQPVQTTLCIKLLTETQPQIPNFYIEKYKITHAQAAARVWFEDFFYTGNITNIVVDGVDISVNTNQ